jgi:hypothetical protein
MGGEGVQGRCVSKDLDTLLTALYVFVDDCVVPPRNGRGRRPALSDSELITLAVAQVLLGFASQRRWVRHLHASAQWRAMFPNLPKQPGYHKRLKSAHPLLCQAILALAAACPSWFDDMWMTDATAVPCGRSRETVKRSDLAGYAGYGYCASHSRYFWGFKLYLVCAGDGMPIMWCLANPKLGEREVVAALLEHNHRLIRTGQILLADKGFAGREFAQLTDSLGLRLLRPDRRDETRPTATATSAASVNGSNRSTKPSKANSTSKTTARAPWPEYSPASPNAYSPWPPPSGTTGPPQSPANDH